MAARESGCPFDVWLGTDGTALITMETWSVVDTGQVNCCDNSNQITCPAEREALCGQVAQHESFVFGLQDNGDGTVTDLNTGSM